MELYTHVRYNCVIKFYVYENYQYMTLSGIQEMPDFTWKLSDEDYAKLKDMGK